jgi:D-lyxose ketol-isomerase
MKRSQINYAIDKAHAIAETFRVCLPTFAFLTADAWRQQPLAEWSEVLDLQLGWDITDFGRGDFSKTGLTLLTLRNGALNSAIYPKPYAEKMLQIQQEQETPWHFHTHKMEDILNRGGGDLCMQLGWATEEALFDERRTVEVSVDGRRRSFKPGETLVLKPGQGCACRRVCITVSGPRKRLCSAGRFRWSMTTSAITISSNPAGVSRPLTRMCP